tara:strand:+ start:586 stop:780 length:195 start_codon:yes stop_codon:yes gene_type:complete
MLFKEVSQGFTFLQEGDDVIRVYDVVGDLSGQTPVFMSQISAKSQKEFEIEISYILMDHLSTGS